MAQLNVDRYSLRLATPLRIGNETLTKREGAIVELRHLDGENNERVGYGDIAPLPGLSQESLDEALHAIPALDTLLACTSLAELTERLSMLPPSTRFGIECAWLEVQVEPRHPLAAAIARTLPLPHQYGDRIEVNGLLDRTAEDLDAMTQEDWSGFNTWKIKVGRRPLAEESEILRQLDERLAPDQRVRLDANRAFEIGEVLELCSACPRQRIEYLEEPLRDPSQLAALHEQSGLPIALDETLHEPNQDLAIAGVAAWVIKPTLLGGVAATLALAERARAIDPEIGCVISSSFESGIGLRALAHLAAAMPTRGCAAGLATAAWLAEDTLDPPFAESIVNGEVEVCAARQDRGDPA